MSYPPDWRLLNDQPEITELIAEYPFAHLITAQDGLAVTRIPFLADCKDGELIGLRSHMNGTNPQAKIIDSADLLIVFSGPSTYVSPHWRTDRQRAATFDYQEVRVKGTATIQRDMGYFIKLVDDLAQLIEPQYAEIGDYPIWQTSDTPEGYIDRLFPHICTFSVAIKEVEMISKLHQPFPKKDRDSIAKHLSRSDRTDSRKIAARIRRLD